jgi:hypothetical protein
MDMKTFSLEHHSAPWRHDLHTTSCGNAYGEALQRVWQTVVNWVTDSYQEPHIWMSHTSQGDKWNAYDPLSGRKIVGATEAEMMVWLEARYNA